MPQNNTFTSNNQSQYGSMSNIQETVWNYGSTTDTSQLPSTVDISAFKAGPSTDPTIKNVNLSSSSSDSDGSDSSSDSDTSSSSEEKVVKPLSKAPQFSVTSSDSAGLRMKIAAIPSVSNIKTTNTKIINKTNTDTIKKKSQNIDTNKNNRSEILQKCENLSSSSSCCSDCSDSDSDTSSEGTTQQFNKKKTKVKQKQANRNGSTSSDNRTEDSSESDSSDELLKEINAEDLAAILPSEELNLLDTNTNVNNKPTTIIMKPLCSSTTTEIIQNVNGVVDCGGSSSDTELPALVTAAIQRVESGSDTESSNKTQPTQYNLTLLRDFVAKTQMLGNSSSSLISKTEINMTTDGKQHSIELLKNEKDIKTESPVPLSTSSTSNKFLNNNNNINNKNNNNSNEKNNKSNNKRNSNNNNTKKKRGRPKKPLTNNPNIITPSSESPDSGILSTPHSPAESPKIETEKVEQTQSSTITDSLQQANGSKEKDMTTLLKESSSSKITKINIASLERSMYATERVLYPPRGKKRGCSSGRQSRSKSVLGVSCNKDENILDPMWRKIDINKKFRRPSTSGYKSDGGNTVCSKKLAAKSGYVSDYSTIMNHNKMSGYRSDFSIKSKKSIGGYKSDFSMKAKSCGYRSDCSIRHRKKVRRKRRTKINEKSIVNEQDILQLAGLSLGQTSEESSRDSYPNTTIKPSILSPFSNGMFYTKKTNSTTQKNSINSLSQKLEEENKTPSVILKSKFEKKTIESGSNKRTTGKDLLNNLCERVTKRISGLDDSCQILTTKTHNEETKNKSRKQRTEGNKLDKDTSVLSSPGKLKDVGKSQQDIKSESVKMRRTSTMSRCSSKSTSSRHPSRRRRRKRVKSRSRSDSLYKQTDISSEIDNLIDSFTELCQINIEKIVKEKLPNEIVKPTTKRVTKKRKGSEHTIDSPSTSSGSKRRNKKTVPTQSPDEHKLPLKKRHYLLTPGEKSELDPDLKESSSSNDTVERFRTHIDEAIDSCISKYTSNSTNNQKLPTKAVTPKKRHFLQSSDPTPTEDVSSSVKCSSSPLTIDSKCNDSSDLSLTESIQLKSQQTQLKKCEIITRKKNRLEGLVSKMLPTTPILNIFETHGGGGGNGNGNGNSTQKLTQKNPQSNRPTVIRTPGQIPPPGIFEPTIDLELQIPSSTISIPSIIAKAEMLDSPRFLADTSPKREVDDLGRKTEKVVESLLTKTGGNLLLKKKRKKINRTGFPTVKRKKKKVIEKETVVHEKNNTIFSSISTDLLKKGLSCDRVPNEGETADIFIERNSRPRLSVVSLERLQGKIPTDILNDDNPTITEANNNNNNNNNNTNNKRKQITEIIEQQPTKRQLRTKPTEKRMRDISLDNQNEQIKRTKTEIQLIKQSEPSERLKKKESRDISSDNEPLINFVNKNTKVITTSKLVKPIEAEKLQTNIKLTKTRVKIEKENLLKKNDSIADQLKIRLSRRQSTQTGDKLPIKETIVGNVGVTATKKRSEGINPELILLKNVPSKVSLEKDIVVDVISNRPLSRSMTKALHNVETPLEEADSNQPVTATSTATTTVLLPKCKEVKKAIVDDQKEVRVKRSKSRVSTRDSATVSKNDPLLTKSEESKEPIKSIAIPKSKSKEVRPERSKSRHATNKSTQNKITNCLLNNNEINETKNPISSIEIIEKLPTDESSFTNDEIPEPEAEDTLEHDPLPSNDGIPSFNLSRDNSPASTISERSSKKNPLWKKKYLTAGLFSDTFKEDETVKNVEKSNRNKVEENRTGCLLPPPPYCEKFFRQTVRDFTLTYDLWWAEENSKLLGRDTVPSWNFKKIRTNIYGDVRTNQSSDHQPCCCKPDSGCPDDCLNRLVYTECSPETCPCGEKCLNQKIQRHEYSPGLDRYMTQNKGWGIRTKKQIQKGSFILEYLGEVVTEREFKDRMDTLYSRDIHHYCLHLDGGLVIDGHRMGSDGRFVNHSCSPNCEMQKWSVNGLFRMALFALRDIKPDEELTYDYNFALFNPAEGQPCHCESSECRGVIGGKSQRIKPIEIKPNESTASNTNVRIGRPRKRVARRNQPMFSSKDGSGIPTFQSPTVRERSIIRDSHCFLIRNLEKIRKLKERTNIATPLVPQTLTAQISALRVPRNIKTRGLALVEHDPELEKTARVAGLLREICQDLANYKDENNLMPMTKLNIPSKKKCPQYFDKILKPIDLSQIEMNVEKGIYKQPKIFDEDVLKIFENTVKFYGGESPEGIAAVLMKSIYITKKEQICDRLVNILGRNDGLKEFLPCKINELIQKTDSNEDIIRCLCGLFKDEGLMIQCSKCLVWQHTECTQADTSIDNYLCERCDNRIVDLEIMLNELTDEGYQYYLSLLRGDLQVRQGDTVYVLRDIPMLPDKTNPDAPIKKHTYETIGEIDYSECDIFRVERLWKDNDGKRFVFGHHYLRPHETYHEPTRKFYPNEVVRVPLYEVVPIELVMARCWVLDTSTFCKGRPVDSIENHVYICELRVDKSARLFSKISKHAHPICMKSYAFYKFERKLKISKTYAPHDLGSVVLKPKKKKPEEGRIISRKNSTSIVQLIPPPPKTISEKRTRLENILHTLMSKKPDDMTPIDLTYLLTGRGARLRRANATIVPI